MMDTQDLTRATATTVEIIDEWAETHPWVVGDDSNSRSMMVARRIARLPTEQLARRFYYDLFEFRCR